MVEETYGPHRGHDTRRAAPGGEPAGGDVRPTNNHPLASHPPGRQSAVLDRSFGRDDIAVLRHEVTDRLIAAGLTADRLHGFVLAVNEIITNVVLHAGGRGRLSLRFHDGWANCTVTDAGPGIPDRFRSAPEIPATSEVGGRGVWLAYQLCDQVAVTSTGHGTSIELRIRLLVSDTSAALNDRAAAKG